MATADVPDHLAGEGRLAKAWRRLGQLIEHGVGGFFAHGGTQRAAAISFYTFFSIFPIAILCVAVLALIANDDTARNQVVNFLLDRLPLNEDARKPLETAMRKATSQGAGLSTLGILTLLFAASNVMGSIRQALNVAFRVQEDRPPAQAKLWDLFGVLVFGVLVTLSFALTFVDNVIDAQDSRVVEVVHNIGRLVPLLIAVLVFTGLFRLVPAKRPRLGDIWPGVLLAAFGYELAKRGFTLYLTHFADYGAVYASLGAVVAFLVFTYVVSFIALLGAEFAAEWPCVRDGEYDGPPGPPFSKQVTGFIKSLFVRT